jgi:hypothetical protein
VPEWFLRSRESEGTYGTPSSPLLRTEVGDTRGAVIVETRQLEMPDEEAPWDHDESLRWETTICPRDAADPQGPDAAVFAVCDRLAEAHVAHEQAVAFSAAALDSTARRGSGG